MENILDGWFESPTQVVWCDEEGNWESGIAFEDYIICACCGSLVFIDEVLENAPVEDPIREFKTWVNISEEIGGDSLLEAREANNDKEE